MTTNLQQLADDLDALLRDALLIADRLDRAGVRQGLGGLALRQCREQLESAVNWSTGVQLSLRL